jgi:polysaccharide chain length determinant protein (PEP-CTERM system associated)
MMADLRFYGRLLLRRSPAMLGIILLCTGVAAVVALRAPTTFRTQAVLLVESAQIPGELAASTVSTSATESITLIQQRLLTRANLLDLAADLNVFPDYSALSPDTIVQQMRQMTSISSRSRRDEPLQITVAFEARNGAVAAAVVNEYVTNIVNANVELRANRAGGTLDFFEQEVARLSNELDQRSARIAEFQSENADALPADQSFRMNRQALLQERLASWDREQATLRDQRARLITIFEATGRVGGRGAEANLSPEERELAQLESELTNALTVLSESNPRVQALERRIAVLRDQVALRDIEAEEAGEAGEIDPNRAMLDLQLAEIDSQIATLDEQITEAEAELTRLEDAIERTPANAITLSGLQRDFENVRQQYDRAVQRLAEASTGERIELSSRGQRITLIEPANVPESPHSPNRPMIVATGAALGVGLAAALFILLEILNRTVRRPAEITRSLGIQPLVTIPYMESRSRKLMRRLAQVATLLLVVGGVPAALWAIDTYYLPLDQLAGRILNRLGLG